MRILDLDACKNLPSIVGYYYDNNGGYCAIGKVLVGLGFNMETIKTNMYEVNEFMTSVGQAVDNIEWQTPIYELNDDGHPEKAFRMAVDTILRSGLATLKTEAECNVPALIA